MALDNSASAIWKLFRDRPFPNIRLLGGGKPEERVRALESVSECDILVVPGGLPDVADGVRLLSELEMPVVYVPGLDECAGRCWPQVMSAGKEAAVGTTVHVLDRESVVLDGVRFLGAALWTSPESARLSAIAWSSQVDEEFSTVDASTWLSDATNQTLADAVSFIYGWNINGSGPEARAQAGRRAFSAIENKRTLGWLNRELARPFEGPTVIVTHFEPELRPKDASNDRTGQMPVGSMLRRHSVVADLWLHGHAKTTSNSLLEGVRIFGGFEDEDANRDCDDLMSEVFSAVAAKRRGKKSIEESRAVLSPEVKLQDGLNEPLSLAAIPIVAVMKRVHKEVDAIVPHTMTRSATLRMCVRRTIYEEVQRFKRAAQRASELQHQVHQPESNLQSLLLISRADYSAPPGYPSKEPTQSGFDYYELLSTMSAHIDELRGLSGRAWRKLNQWTSRTAEVLQELEARDLDVCVVAPPVQAIRLPKLCEVIEVHVRCDESEIEPLREALKKKFCRDASHPFVVRLNRVGDFAEVGKRLLTLPNIADLATNYRHALRQS